MLRNKYVVIVVAVLLSAVVAYNYYFFRAQRALKQGRSPRTLQAGGTGTGAASASGPVSGYHASWQRDPFWYLGGVDKTHHAAAKPSSGQGLVLEGTMTKEGKGYALINGNVYGIGETVRGVTIIEIGELYVKLKSSAGTKTIFIANDLIKKEK